MRSVSSPIFGANQSSLPALEKTPVTTQFGADAPQEPDSEKIETALAVLAELNRSFVQRRMRTSVAIANLEHAGFRKEINDEVPDLQIYVKSTPLGEIRVQFVSPVLLGPREAHDVNRAVFLAQAAEDLVADMAAEDRAAEQAQIDAATTPAAAPQPPAKVKRVRRSRKRPGPNEQS